MFLGPIITPEINFWFLKNAIDKSITEILFSEHNLSNFFNLITLSIE